MSRKSLAKYVEPLYGQPCWGIDYRRQTNLSMNFGAPALQVREPYTTNSPSPTVQQLASRRLVTIRGEWWLWLWCCYWRLTLKQRILATGSSAQKKIDNAISHLAGQKLISTSVDPKSGFTRFEFDLGCELQCRRFDRESDDELWLLYRPRGYVLSVNGNGTYCHQRASDSVEHWKPISDEAKFRSE